ncbi:MAG: MFS transporter, partial [Beijerinckiaceae bacterium]|nr:MFS transporter [Beijerinckiaceae bacterium]
MDKKNNHGGNRSGGSAPHKGGARRPGSGGPGRPAEPLSMAPGQAVRMAAAAAISGILASGRTVDERMAAETGAGASAGLEPRDAALMRSIVVVALRRLGTIRLALDRFMEQRPPRKAQALEGILIAGVAQILFLEAPDHSAVDLAVRAAKHESATAPFANLVNAVLRNVIRHREELLAVADPFADTPSWL